MSTTTRARRPSTPPRRPTRRRALVRRWVAVLVVLGVVVLIGAVLFSPLLSVRAVDVTGISRLPADQVRKAAGVQQGTSMLGVDTQGAATRVAGLAPVASVTVSRSWPGTIEIAVTERRPVAWARAADGSLQLVDDKGVPFASTATPPKGTVELRVNPLQAGSQKITVALAVYRSISPQLRAKTVAVTGNTPGDVQLNLRGGKTVKWGDASDPGRKNQVIAALLTRKGKVYDVATPDMPTVQ